MGEIVKNSQCDQIIRYLSKGRALTTFAAFLRFGITTLSQRVGELKRRRWPIESKTVTIGKARVSKYFIPAARLARVRRRLS